MINELGGLACAPLWAISSILLKSQTGKFEAMQINAVRGIFASAFVLVILPFARFENFYDLTIYSVTLLLSSIVVGMIVGDTLFIKGMGIIGVSRALPISIIYPIFVLPFSIVLTDENLSMVAIGGIFITILGLYLITAPKRGSEQLSVLDRKQQWQGVFFVLGACLCWAAGTLTLKFAITSMDPLLAGAIRMPFMTMAIFLILQIRKENIKFWNMGKKTIIALAIAGILGIGIGGLFFMVGVKSAGPTKTAMLSSTAPFFGVPLSMLTLREKITMKIILGTIFCVAGIWLVI